MDTMQPTTKRIGYDSYGDGGSTGSLTIGGVTNAAWGAAGLLNGSKRSASPLALTAMALMGVWLTPMAAAPVMRTQPMTALKTALKPGAAPRRLIRVALV